MINKRILKFIFFVLILCSCSKKNKNSSFTIIGEIKGEIPDTIFLTYGNKREKSIFKKNKFYFSGKVENPISAEFTIHPASTIDKVFYLENKKIDVFLDVEKKIYSNFEINFIKIDSVKGTKTSLILSNFYKYKELHKNDLDWENKLYTRLNEIISKNPSNEMSGDLLLKISKDSILINKSLEKLFFKLDTTKQSLNTINSLKETIFISKKNIIGKQILDFSLPNDKHNVVSTTDYRNSILLIDFWASWCKPCREQNPKLIEIYNKYKNLNFKILGVSIDKEERKWLKAIEKDKLPWENVIDTLGIKSQILIRYKAATSVPRNYLIDEKGFLLEIDIDLDKLENFLEKNKKIKRKRKNL